MNAARPLSARPAISQPAPSTKNFSRLGGCSAMMGRLYGDRASGDADAARRGRGRPAPKWFNIPCPPPPLAVSRACSMTRNHRVRHASQGAGARQVAALRRGATIDDLCGSLFLSPLLGDGQVLVGLDGFSGDGLALPGDDHVDRGDVAKAEVGEGDFAAGVAVA